jgi:hypothetical protein
MLDEDEDIAAVRAADGRGPLFWAHEAKNDEAIELLKVSYVSCCMQEQKAHLGSVHVVCGTSMLYIAQNFYHP